ncbi:efflux RND transporter permease subunit [Actibacterium sp. 188UL27-1]|uniref:efflux RND transporter permease subunit n=1 Tax=Actibacterium sp. 188UL27-1 TaxID=2786961 RepID=UPI001956A019|nr:efflux RND transporter permease subunit [Actibacterium sp. 188UL27-1]
MTTDGFSDDQNYDFALYHRREILAVEGVADVELAGLPQETIYVEPNLAVAANQNIPVEAVVNALAMSDSLVDAGELGNTRLQTADGTDSVSDIAGPSVGLACQVVNTADIATVSRERIQDPGLMIRHYSSDISTIGIAGLATENIVEVGKRVDARLAEIITTLPAGVDLHSIYEQHEVVDAASNVFLVNLAMSSSSPSLWGHGPRSR